jgi:NAD(P)-dependent dehydrogenase (short-subunit alcohol dehydrogenase family)
MTDEFANKVVMITGAGGNLGQAVALRFQQGGASLALVGRGEAELQAVAAQTGGLPVVADVTDPASISAAVATITARFGRIDVLAHTVGGYAAGTPVHEDILDTWDKMMALNARSVLVTAGGVASHMVAQRIAGRIVVVLSRAAFKGAANHAAYNASKAAAQRIVESMATELADYGITVNGVSPSVIDTPPNRNSMPKADFSKWVQPGQLADAIAFLALDSSGAINGETLEVNSRS